MADSRSESKKNLLNALSQIIGISENFDNSDIRKVNLNVREHSKKLFDLIQDGYFTGVFADALAELLNDLSEIFEKGVKYND